MKKKYIVFICLGALIFSIAGVIVTAIIKENAKYNITGKITSVSVSGRVDKLPDPTVIFDEGEIDVLLKCLKKVKINNRHLIRNISTSPWFYEITFTFEDGKTKTYEYIVYPATKCSNPFEDFYKLFSQEGE
ncbi:MAG: hypothetical protein IJN46_03325 [Lachnospiraceae bacterium]|nr:hypothetical protein [Lachnospiraceae bacterium]